MTGLFAPRGILTVVESRHDRKLSRSALSRLVGWIIVTVAILSLIIVPFITFGADFERWAADSIQRAFDLPLIVALFVAGLLTADVLLPVPSSVISTASGTFLGLPLGAVASAVGMTLGCVLGFVVGRTTGLAATSRFVGPRELQRLSAAAERHGDWVLVSARAVPVLAEASTVFAGMSGISFRRFLSLVTLSNFGISLVYSAVGSYAVDVSSFLLAVAAAVMLPALAAALFRTLSRVRRSRRVANG